MRKRSAANSAASSPPVPANPDDDALLVGRIGQELQLQLLIERLAARLQRLEIGSGERAHFLVGAGEQGLEVGALLLDGAQRFDGRNDWVEAGKLLGELGAGADSTPGLSLAWIAFDGDSLVELVSGMVSILWMVVGMGARRRLLRPAHSCSLREHRRAGGARLDCAVVRNSDRRAASADRARRSSACRRGWGKLQGNVDPGPPARAGRPRAGAERPPLRAPRLWPSSTRSPTGTVMANRTWPGAAGRKRRQTSRDRRQSGFSPTSFAPSLGRLRRPNWNERALRRRLRVLRGDREQRLERMQDRAGIKPYRPRVGAYDAAALRPRRQRRDVGRLERADNVDARRQPLGGLRLRQAEGRPQILEEARNLRFQGGSGQGSPRPPDARKRGSTCALRTRGRRRSRRHGAITHDQRHVRCSGLNFPRGIVRQKAALVKGAGRSQLEAFRLGEKIQALHGCCACSA